VVNRRIKTSLRGRRRFKKKNLTNLKKEYGRITKRLDALYIDKLGRGITENEYDKFAKQFIETRNQIEYKISNYSENLKESYINSKKILSLSSNAYNIFEGSEVDQKRDLLNYLLQNFKLKQKTLLYDLKKPFDIILKSNKTENWLCGLDFPQTISIILPNTIHSCKKKNL